MLVPIKNEFLLRSAAITFGVHAPDSPVPVDEIADAVLANFQASFQVRIDPSVTVGPAILTFDQAPGQRGSISGTDTFVGTRAGNNAIPPQIAAIVRKRTARVGRPGRGRFYLPWCLDRDDVQENGLIDPTERDLLQASAEAFLDDLETASTRMVVLHDEGIPGSTTPSAVTSLFVDPQSGTQRRRNRS